MAASLVDKRQPAKVKHEIEELLAQRIYGMACGYADANDAARLAEDPVHKMLVGRDPVAGADLASQPTLSRFENAPDRKQLYRMGEALAERVIERHRRRLHGRARRITLDLDPTDDPTHGAPQLSFFNGHYDTWCYLPVAGFVSFNDEKEQYLFTAVLRPGNAVASRGAIGIPWRILKRVWEAFPKARLQVRLDGGFADPLLLEFLDAMGVEYGVAMAKNAVLSRLAEPEMKEARQLSEESSQTEHVYGEGRYAAQTWLSERRVILKAEVVRPEGKEPKENPQFVLTNLKQNPQWIYEQVYCERGDIENRIKELHHGLEIDRTSCSAVLKASLPVLQNRDTLGSEEEVQEFGNRNEPSVLARQSLHQPFEIRLQFAVLHESVPEMGIQDARSSLLFQAVLIVFADGLAKALPLRTLTRGKKVADERTQRIGVRHPGASAERVDVRKYEVAAVANLLPADIPPKGRVALDVAEEFAVGTARGSEVIDGTSPSANSCRAPIQRFLVVVIRHRTGRSSKKLFKAV